MNLNPHTRSAGTMAANRFGISLLQIKKGKSTRRHPAVPESSYNEMFGEIGLSDVIYSIPVNLEPSLTWN